jgi:hypothetical protein
MRTLTLTLLTLLLNVGLLRATHNRGGEIIYTQLDELTISATVVTYTSAFSPADRDSITLCWGDGTCDRVARSNGEGSPPQGQILFADFRLNRYQATHTFAAPGNYTLSVTDPNRTANILNIDAGNSVSVPFHLETTFALSPGAPGALNSAPVPLVPPLNLAFVGQPFFHVIHAADPDGDSLAYALTTPLAGAGTAVPNYLSPTEIVPGAENQLDLDPQTGALTWDAPQLPGLYTLAVAITAYRNGEEVDRVIRDMQILVSDAFSPLPELEVTAIVAKTETIDLEPGDTLTLRVQTSRTAPDAQPDLAVFSELLLDSLSGATFTFESDTTGRLTWVVPETAIREQPYQFTLRAQNADGYANFATRLIRVNQLINTYDRPVPPPLAVNVFPNPFSTQVHFSLAPHDRSAPIDLELYTPTGQLLYRTRQAPAGRQVLLTIPNTVLPRPGLYWYRMRQGSIATAGKILWQP